MADEQDGAVLLEIAQPANAFLLEERVAHRKCLVDDQYIRVHMGNYRKGEAQVHAAGIGLDRLIDKIADLGEGFDVRKPRLDLRLAEAKHRGVQMHVFAAGELRIEACAQF